MRDYIEFRVLIAKYADESLPTVIGAMDESTYEVIPPEDWDGIVREWKEQWLADWPSYDFAEAVVSVPSKELAQLFQPGRILGSAEAAS